MIVFSGVISSKVELKTAKKRSYYGANICLIAVAAVDIFAGIDLLYNDIINIKEMIFYNAIALVPIFFFKYVPPQKHLYNYNYHITINNEEIVCVDNFFKKTRRKKLKQIRKVIDAGECFYVIYKWGDICNCIICQKDLIREGTLEEFEELFKGKIVKEKEKKVFKRKNK